VKENERQHRNGSNGRTDADLEYHPLGRIPLRDHYVQCIVVVASHTVYVYGLPEE
jgi:hypothetical protein